MTTIKPFYEFFEQKHFPFSSVFFPGTFCLPVSLSFLFFNINLYSLPVGVSPGTTDQFSTCLSAICFVYISFRQELRNKRNPAFEFLFLSFYTEATVSYFTAFICFFRYFSVDQSSGELNLRQNIPGGSYWLRVEVSDGVWPDVISGVRVHVWELEEKAILSSASLRLTGSICTNTDLNVGMNAVD